MCNGDHTLFIEATVKWQSIFGRARIYNQVGLNFDTGYNNGETEVFDCYKRENFDPTCRSLGSSDSLDKVKNWRKGRRIIWSDGPEYDLDCDTEDDYLCSKIWKGRCSYRDKSLVDVIDPETGKNIRVKDKKDKWGEWLYKNKQKTITVTKSRKTLCPGLNGDRLKVRRAYKQEEDNFNWKVGNTQQVFVSFSGKKLVKRMKQGKDKSKFVKGNSKKIEV